MKNTNIYHNLYQYLPSEVECFAFDEIDSTNDYLAQQTFSTHPQVCISNQQFHGKGQYNRAWLSAKNSSILFSIRHNFALETSLNGLSLVVGLALIDVLSKDYGLTQLKLKWPNDVYFKTQKLAGILLENQVQNTTQSVIIGLGVNYHLKLKSAPSTPWIDLQHLLHILPDRLDLSAKIINKILKYCTLFAQKGWGVFQQKWQQYDYLYGKAIQYQNMHGIAVGVSEDGALKLKSGEKIEKIYSSKHLRVD